MQSKEQKVQNNIEAYLRSLQKQNKPIFFEKRQAGGYTYKKGMPDMYIVVNSKHIEIEIKKHNGKASSMQLAWKKKLKELYNIDSYIVDRVEQVEKIIVDLL